RTRASPRLRTQLSTRTVSHTSSVSHSERPAEATVALVCLAVGVCLGGIITGVLHAVGFHLGSACLRDIWSSYGIYGASGTTQRSPGLPPMPSPTFRRGGSNPKLLTVMA